MSLYHIIFLGLLVGAVTEHVKGKTPKGFFILSFMILTAVLCLRFGVGKDYFSYAQIYRVVPANPIEAFTDSRIHSEPGWKLLCSLLRVVNVTFPGFVFTISVYMMVLFYRFLRLYGGERKMLALVISYHTLYMTYFHSILRQGIIVATLLGLLIPWLFQRKYIRYCLVVLLLSSLHTISLLLLILPLLHGVKLNIKHTVCLVILGLLAGTLFVMVDLAAILNQIKSHIYFAEAEISVFTILERVATFAIVTMCVYLYADGKEPESKNWILALYKFYALGLFLYGLLMWSSLIASRTVYIFKVMEIILICACITKCKKTAVVVLCYCLLLSSVMYVKNVQSYLQQAEYQNATFFSYPYVSIFNQEDILNYRRDILNYPFQ